MTKHTEKMKVLAKKAIKDMEWNNYESFISEFDGYSNFVKEDETLNTALLHIQDDIRLNTYFLSKILKELQNGKR